MSLIFECNLSSIIKEKGIKISQIKEATPLSNGTLYSLINRGQFERIDRKTTAELMNYLNCSFRDLWSIYHQ